MAIGLEVAGVVGVGEPEGAGEAGGARVGAALGSAPGSVGSVINDSISVDVILARPEEAEVRKAVC